MLRPFACAILLAVTMASNAFASMENWDRDELGLYGVFQMKSAPYPHASRENGWTNSKGVAFTADHYSDSSVALLVPNGFKAGESVDLVFYLHGHNNNVRKAIGEFRLREMLQASGKNAILVFPEAPKDVPDSGAGKLEDADGLKNLANEVVETLAAEHVIASKQLGRVVLSGHSGAYKGLAACAKHGGLDQNVTDIYLLDASYGGLDNFVGWIERHPEGRFVSIFTDHLADENKTIMDGLTAKNISFVSKADTDAADSVLKAEKRLFLHTTTLDHNRTVTQLERWLRTSTLPERGPAIKKAESRPTGS